ncbi:flagellar motor control protein ZomB [Nocardia sp. NPDC055321]
MRRSARVTLIGGITCTAVLFAMGGWERRWIADDGLTVLRTVRNLLAGNGPVFNQGERVEVNTSTAWTYLIWFFGWITQARLEYVALGLALTLSVAAIVFAMLGAARLWGGASSVLLPAGALVYIAIPPARDFATSGLESGLVICWLAVLWWLLVRWSSSESPSPAGVLGLSFWIGLAPLIRPEMAVIGIAALLMVVCAPLPSTQLRPWVFRAAIVAAAGAVPGVYQVWRMGYYGLPYPNTAVAKDATGAKWRQGSLYLWDLVGPYWLWAPLPVLAVAAVVVARSRSAGGSPSLAGVNAAPRERVRDLRTRVRTPATVVMLMLGTGVLLTVYEIRVGGDFMHGRMLLPQLFCLLLPVMVLPLRLSVDRVFAVVSAAVAGSIGWALAIADTTAITTANRITAAGVADERLYYIQNTGRAHPIRAEDYLNYPRIRAMLADVSSTPGGGLLINTPTFTAWHVVPPPAPLSTPATGHTVYYVNLGMISMNMPLHVRVIDPVGLAYPLAAHTIRFPDARIGHDKNLDADWAIVDARVAVSPPGLPQFIDETWVSRIRTAITCPDTQDVLDSTRAPLTLNRFLHNVFHALPHARYRIDRVPEFELARCNLTSLSTVR